MCYGPLRTPRTGPYLSLVIMPYAIGSLTLLILVGAIACQKAADNTAPQNDPCMPAVITAGNGIANFKQRIPKQTAVAPADSVLDVILTFASAPTQNDRDQIGLYNGTNVANAATINALRAEFPAANLANYVAADTGRLTDAAIYVPACTTK